MAALPFTVTVAVALVVKVIGAAVAAAGWIVMFPVSMVVIAPEIVSVGHPTGAG